ncbi:LGFP repeat-containing protein, partial [Arthrobacter yangruifuii]|uniref:LGFP repeat-containing protein n=1 Tax=Arthrobacter yangruifuii TaxID=2606616 RepID=UPI0024848568
MALLAASLTAGGLPAQGLVSPGAPVQSQAPAPTDPEEAPAGQSDPAETAVPAPAPSGTPGLKMMLPGSTAPAATPTPAPTATTTATPTAEAEESEEDKDKGYEPVVGGGFPVPGPATPLVTDPDGTVRSAVETDISAMHDEGVQSFSSTTGGASTAGAASRSGTIQVTMVFATLTDNRGSVDQEAAKKSIKEANEYWRAMSNGRLGMSIVKTRTLNSTANSGQDYAAMMNTIRRDLQWYEDPNEALVVFVPAGDLRSGGYGGILGGGWTSGPTSGSVLMPRPSGFTNNVVTHELGHVLGLLHANSLKCNNGRADVGVGSNGNWNDGSCTSREYGDTSDLMGYAQYSLPVINSYFWDAGVFGRGNEIRNVGTPGSSATYTLLPWAGTAANRAVKFKDTSGETYYLELRTPVGYDAGTAVGGNRGVKIVKADLANNWAVNSLVVAPNTRDFAGYTNANSTWQAGQTFTTHAGTTVRINSVTAGSASITIKNGAAGRAAGPIAAARAAHPELGAAVSGVVDGGLNDGAYQNFAKGAILWSPATGAKVSPNGAIRTAYQKSGFENGPLGYPRSDEMTIPGGKYQDFTNGAILWSSATGAQISVNGAIRTAYQKSGFEGGPLGFPTSGEVTIPGGKYQNFAKGAILWSSATGAQISPNGAIRTAYQKSGFENGPLGFPTSGEVTIKGGKYQNFTKGAILWSSATGAQVSPNGAIRTAYQKSGFEGGPLGFPTSGEVSASGGKYQNFAKGTIYWTASTGAQVSPNGSIRDAYKKAGQQGGTLGFPTSGEVTIKGGKYQNFAKGAILWSSATGAQVSPNGAIRTAYQKSGFEGGPLGFPTSGEVSASGGKYQNFAK